MRTFYKLFESIEEAVDVNEKFVEGLELDAVFKIGSELVNISEINEKDKAKFLVQLVKQYNLA